MAGAPGVAHGYLGFGLDVYGNYVNRASVGSSACASDQAAGAEVKDSIGVRGPGNGTSGYCMLARAVVGDQGLDKPSSTSRPAPVPVEIALNPSTSSATTTAGLVVAANSWVMRVGSYNGSYTLSGTLPSMAGYADPSWLDASGRPYQVTFGWAGSTGGSMEVHEVNTLAAETVTGKLPVYTLSTSDNQNGNFLAGDRAVVSVTPALSASEGDEAATATVTTTFPAGIVPRSGAFTTNGYSCTTSGQVVTCTYTPGTTLTAGSSLPTADIPVTIPVGTSPRSYTISAKVSSADANPATATRTVTVSRFAATASGAISYGANETLSISGLPTGATGSVAFTDAASRQLCVIADVTAGTSCAVLSPAAGSYAVTATYTPAASSPYASHTATTSFAVSKSPAPFSAQLAPGSPVYGTSAAVTASGLPTGATGTVAFSDSEGHVLCTATLPATSCFLPASLKAGSHAITATYSGDGNYTGSTATTSVTVQRATLTLTAAVAEASIDYGSSTTLSHSGLTLSGATAATGSVRFTDGDGRVLCTATLPDSSCVTSVSLPVGSYDITATYAGDANHAEAVATPVSLDVVKAPTTLTATAASGHITYGDNDTLSYAGLTLAGATAATGTVTFTDADGHVLCAASLPDTSCTTAEVLPAGTYEVTATYSGDGNHLGSSAEHFTLTVGTRGTEGMTAAATPSSTPYATAETLSYAGLPLTGATAATGTVTFTDGDGEELCTATLPETSCEASVELPVGTYEVTATYSGDSNHEGTTAATSFAVTKAATTVSVVPYEGRYGSAAELTATGLPAGASGMLTFTDDEGEVLCTATLPEASCLAPADLGAGTHAVTVGYSGDRNHSPSSASGDVVIAKSAFPVSATLSVSVATLGQPSTVTVAGVPADATGTIQVSSDGITLCTIVLPATSCTLAASLAVGEHALDVSYAGDDNYEAASGVVAFRVIAVPHVDEPAPTSPAGGGPISIPVPPGPGISGAIVDGPDHGTAEIVDGELVYTPDDGFSGTDTVTYRVLYADGSSRLVTVTFTVPAEAERPQLASTGATVGPLGILAAVLLAGGVALVVGTRVRPRSRT